MQTRHRKRAERGGRRVECRSGSAQTEDLGQGTAAARLGRCFFFCFFLFLFLRSLGARMQRSEGHARYALPASEATLPDGDGDGDDDEQRRRRNPNCNFSTAAARYPMLHRGVPDNRYRKSRENRLYVYLQMCLLYVPWMENRG